jgi:hypothetical protein
MRPIWWPKFIAQLTKHKMYRKNIEDFLLNVAAHKPIDECAFVPYRSVGFYVPKPLPSERPDAHSMFGTDFCRGMQCRPLESAARGLLPRISTASCPAPLDRTRRIASLPISQLHSNYC